MANETVLDAKERLSYAESDLGVADHLFKTYRPKPLEIICFHCQQAAEKAVKSIIVLKGSQGGLPKRHDLFLLLNQVKNMVKIDEKFYDYADVLTPYGIAMRYPNELFLEERHAKKALDMASEFVNWSKYRYCRNFRKAMILRFNANFFSVSAGELIEWMRRAPGFTLARAERTASSWSPRLFLRQSVSRSASIFASFYGDRQ